MKLFMQYLRQKWRVLAAFTLFAAVLAVCFALYRLPLRAVWYPLALCAALGLSLLTADFLRLCRRHETLCRLRAAPDPAQLPSPAGICEEDDQALVRALDERARRAETETDARMRAMIDYYTLWAHQIKTPISAMRLTLQSEESDTARRLSSDLRRVEQYVEMVMVYLRLDSESTDFVIRAYDLDGIIRAAVRPFAGEFIGRRLQLHYELLDYRAVTDEKWLGFVIGQVLSNALKYTSRGGITISMPEHGILSIRDTGMGIAPEDLPRIFEREYTGCNGRTDRRSSGIGLYLCRRVCDALGHTITARSAPGEGTEIRIDLRRRGLTIE